MYQKKWKYWAFILNIFGCIQFIILTIMAMFYYKGGTYVNSTTQDYLLFYNYFSDLGRIIAHSGNLNMTSFILFTFTLSFWGVSHIPFYIAFLSFFNNFKRMKLLSFIGSNFGIFTGIFFVAISFTPSDIVGFWHDIFVFLGFGSIFISICLYTIVIFQNKEYSIFYAILYAITSIILAAYYLILFFFPYENSPSVLFIFVTGQKLIIYTLLICEIIQGYGAIRQLES